MTTELPESGNTTQAVAVMRDGVIAGEASESVLAIASSCETLRVATAQPEGSEARLGDDSIFLLASITKTFFGTAVMQLTEQGRLALTDPVVRYIPEFGRYDKGGITIWHLLTHTSGLAEEMEQRARRERVPASAHLEVACDAFTRFAPGAEWEYSNLAFWVLAEVIARVSGLPYPEYLELRLLDPLGMADTGFRPRGEQEQRYVRVPKEAESDTFSADLCACLALPSGGLCSSARDLVRYGQAMLRGWRGEANGVLGRAAIAAMTRTQTAGIPCHGTSRQATWGLAWEKPGAMHLGTPAAFGHGGATATLLWIEPDLDLVFVYLTNVLRDSRVAHLALNTVLAGL